MTDSMFAIPSTVFSLSSGTCIGPGFGRARRRLREGCRHRRVERDVPFDFLHHLMNMSLRTVTEPNRLR